MATINYLDGKLFRYQEANKLLHLKLYPNLILMILQYGTHSTRFSVTYFSVSNIQCCNHLLKHPESNVFNIQKYYHDILIGAY
ncbi:MAG TPA: hypothetical protein DCF44_12470 [Chitinophagaceae bacterium]|nr:hypothetical protein [Chitinophagaceae bacterium]